MASQLSQQNPDAELQAAFRRHLPQRLRTLLRRARAQCRHGWDCNVLRALHDEIALLAGACGRYGMLETGERLLALESALAAPLAVDGVPDAAATSAIDTLLDSLRPHLQQGTPGPARPAWSPDATMAAAQAPFPRCEVPPADYWRALGIADVGPPATASAANEPAANLPDPVPEVETRRGPRVCIVNDDDAIVNELLLHFDQQGCGVTLVDRLDDLVEKLGKAPPDLAIVVADKRTVLDRLAGALQDARAVPASRIRLLMLLREPDVDLQLRALRAGADRCIVLPATSAETIGAALELANLDQDSAYRILIVDDDAPQALFAQAILRRAGMETKILGEALAVLEELDRFRPDLLLLDLNMPDCDGFELTTLIRERDGYVNTPIVFLSGDLDEERQFAALDAGGDDFLVKPIRPTHLVSAVTNRVRRARTAAARVRHRRQRDAGTGLHERAQLLDAVSEYLAGGGAHAGHGGVLAVELRDASELRQRLGPVPFDAILAQVGSFVALHARAGCMVARYGAAGFLVFAPGRGETELLALANELTRVVQDARFGAQAFAVRLTSAICAFDASINDSALVLVLVAVERTLAGARAQPAKPAVYTRLGPDPDAVATRIKAALAADAFGLAFQPVIPIHGAAEPHYQALLRLRTGEREYVAAELVPAAIRTGSIAAIDAWVVQRCIAILAERLHEGDPVRLTASQSLQGWRDIGRLETLQSALAASAIHAGSLVLEFPATDIGQDLRTLLAIAPRLRRVDVRVALAGVDGDVVAKGWIEQLPLDFVKLAPALDEPTLAGVVQAAHAHGLRVVAPCVETLVEVERLRHAGVDLLQGNYFRAPAAELGEALPTAET